MIDKHSWVHRCLIVPDKYVVFARNLTFAIAGESGNNMWTTALSNSGKYPATHWISAGMITSEFAALLPCNDIGYGGSAETTAKIASSCGVKTTKEQLQELFDNSDCTTEEALEALQRLDLKLIE